MICIETHNLNNVLDIFRKRKTIDYDFSFNKIVYQNNLKKYTTTNANFKNRKIVI